MGNAMNSRSRPTAGRDPAGGRSELVDLAQVDARVWRATTHATDDDAEDHAPTANACKGTAPTGDDPWPSPRRCRRRATARGKTPHSGARPQVRRPGRPPTARRPGATSFSVSSAPRTAVRAGSSACPTGVRTAQRGRSACPQREQRSNVSTRVGRCTDSNGSGARFGPWRSSPVPVDRAPSRSTLRGWLVPLSIRERDPVHRLPLPAPLPKGAIRTDPTRAAT
jgi:hypothetical protein